MQLRVWEIESDIEAKQFDASLEKYRFRERCAVLQQPLTLVEVWCRYCEFKTPQWAETTVILHINRISKHIEALPFQKLSDANDILMYLIKTQSQDTTCRILAEIKASCNWAFKSKLITSNPFADISFKPRRLNQRLIRLHPLKLSPLFKPSSPHITAISLNSFL